MKRLLPALLFVLATTTSYAAMKSTSGHYILILPGSTIETESPPITGRAPRIPYVSCSSRRRQVSIPTGQFEERKTSVHWGHLFWPDAQVPDLPLWT